MSYEFLCSFEEEHLRTRRLQYSQRSKRRLHLGSSGRIRVPRIHLIQQPLSGQKVDKRIGKAATAMARLTKRVWDNADHENQDGRL